MILTRDSIMTTDNTMSRAILTAAAILALAASCSAPQSAGILLTRDTSFTGRGNSLETLLEMTVTPEGPCTVKTIEVALNAADGDIRAIHAAMDGNVLASAAVRPGKSLYRLKCQQALDSASVITVKADIAPDATEGGKVSADIAEVRLKGAKLIPEAPEPGEREILLCRTCIFRPGDYESKNYRIPALRVLRDGTLLTATDKRKFNQDDLPEDIDVVVRRSTDGGHTWSEPVTVAEGKGRCRGYGDAILTEAADGTVICAFVGGSGLWRPTEENPTRSYVTRSTDGGRTWSELEDVTDIIYGPTAIRQELRGSDAGFFGSGTGLLLTKGEHAGRIMIVTAVMVPGWRLDNYAFYSDDNGKTWNISELAYKGGDESKVVELSDGRILMSVRRKGERGWNISTDGGETWGEQQKWSDICTNACDGDIIRLSDGTLIHSLPNSKKRENVSIFVSTDEGQTWPYSKSICPGKSVYSSLAELPDGTIGAYIEENGGSDGIEMWYMNFSRDWLMQK